MLGQGVDAAEKEVHDEVDVGLRLERPYLRKHVDELFNLAEKPRIRDSSIVGPLGSRDGDQHKDLVIDAADAVHVSVVAYQRITLPCPGSESSDLRPDCVLIDVAG